MSDEDDVKIISFDDISSLNQALLDFMKAVAYLSGVSSRFWDIGQEELAIARERRRRRYLRRCRKSGRKKA